jgi:hypothetical protein
MLIMEVGLGQKEAVEDLVASQRPGEVRSWIKTGRIDPGS